MVSSLISSIQGTLERLGPDWADVSVGGVTFRVCVPSSAVDQLGRLGDQTRLFTSLQVREDSLTLYGFPTEDARIAFDVLIGISGVGPRLAVSVLSRVSPESLAVAVANSDVDAFIAVPGVGKKTASRIVLELKGKLEGDWAVVLRGTGSDEVIDALNALGYSLAEARDAVSRLGAGNGASVEERVREALGHLGG
ncbi:MAG: Holliday junction branch migration protein RuvA [Chloroflexi bacterium]|nr:Holliday junction branch migration protein RuvA [Chloroflexota bacterium]